MEKKRKMVKVLTTMPEDIKQRAKEQGITIQSLIIRGWQTIDSFPQLLERVRELEIKTDRLTNRLAATQQELWSLKK